MNTKKILAQPVRVLGLQNGTLNKLTRGGIYTVGELLQKTKEELLKVYFFNEADYKDCKKAMKKLGLNLGQKV